MDIHARQDCKMIIHRIHELRDSGIFRFEKRQDPLQQSAFIDLMICLRDLMYKTETHAKRINFTDDVLINEDVKDITDAIASMRNACCHINTLKRVVDSKKNRASYCIAYGKSNFMKVDDFELKSEYEDDVAVFYGRNRLYFTRHILRAFNEAEALLEPLLMQPGI